jgi:hypothetical protein
MERTFSLEAVKPHERPEVAPSRRFEMVTRLPLMRISHHEVIMKNSMTGTPRFLDCFLML